MNGIIILTIVCFIMIVCATVLAIQNMSYFKEIKMLEIRIGSLTSENIELEKNLEECKQSELHGDCQVCLSKVKEIKGMIKDILKKEYNMPEEVSDKAKDLATLNPNDSKRMGEGYCPGCLKPKDKCTCLERAFKSIEELI